MALLLHRLRTTRMLQRPRLQLQRRPTTADEGAAAHPRPRPLDCSSLLVALPHEHKHASPPWRLTATRTLRNFRVNVLLRNQSFIRKTKSSFEVEKEWELGIVLQPSEVKSLRDRNADLSAAFAEFYKHELYLHQLHIPVWRHGLIGRPEPMRVRKLLAHRSELKKLEAFMTKPNAQLVPSRLEISKTGWIKVILAQCYKVKTVDTRKRDDEREVKRQMRDW